MFEFIADSVALIAEQTQKNIKILLSILLLLWGIFFLNRFLLGNYLLHLGLRPRKISGLLGIVFSPFLHANFNHIFFNSIPFIVLADFILLQGISHFLQITVLIMLCSGVLVWCFAKSGLHVGASGVITGYWGYLVAHAYYQSTAISLMLAAICIVYFAGVLWSIFPGKQHISWQSHLFGMLSGFGIAYYL